jgi:hypothetical protein
MRLAVPPCLACAAALIVAIAVTRSAKAISEEDPPLVSHAAAPEEFVPAGWRVWQIRKGDLNKDGVSDAALIMRHGDSGDTYRLVIVFGNSAGGFDLAADNSELLTVVPDGDSVACPVSEGLKIRHGVFTVQMQKEGTGGATRITFTFRYQDNRFVLIGYDYLGSHHGWRELSFNMLTGQVVETEGPFSEGPKRVVEKRRTGTFARPKPVVLDKLGHGFDFNENFNPFKYAPRDALR